MHFRSSTLIALEALGAQSDDAESASTGDEQEMEKEKEEHHMSLIDPFDVMGQAKWMEFMESKFNLFVGIREGESLWNLLIAVMFLLISVAFFAMDLKDSTQNINYMRAMKEKQRIEQQRIEQQKHINKEILYLVLRCLLTLYLAPFIMTTNVVALADLLRCIE